MSKTHDTAVVLNDAHCPFQDERALKPVMEFITDLQPDVVFINGDMIDFAGISRFSTNPLRTLSRTEIRIIAKHNKKNPDTDLVMQAAIQRELNETFDVLQRIRAAAPFAKLHYIFGNHEYRLFRYLIDRAPELAGITRAGQDQAGKEILDLGYLLRFDELGINKVFSGQKESFMRWGKRLVIGHFDMVRKHSGWTAKGLIEDKGISLIQAHTHRLGSFFRTQFGGEVQQAHENGCLCSLSPEYMTSPNWQQGLCVVTKHKKTDHFCVQPLPLVNYRFSYGNKSYSGGAVRKKVRKPTEQSA